MYIAILLSVVFLACLAILWTEGMWSNAIGLINVVTSALLATNYWEPTARWLENFSANFKTYTFIWDFLALWGLFVLFLSLFRLATDLLSRVRVRFLKVVNIAGGVFFAAWIGWVMVGFTATSLHLVPLGRTYFLGSFVPESRAGASETWWLGFVQRESRGVYCRTASEALKQRYPDWQQEETRTFDPRGEFMPKYATRRAILQRYNEEYESIRMNPGHMDEYLGKE